ncbi:hypothetical protein KR009_005132 [Drosophila setifemur]|nr:hypothetical protein KR009_005132 [Drosophila setifemur]
MDLTKVYHAATVFRHLNGILSVYKPAGTKVKHVRNAILGNACKGLNEMEQRDSRIFPQDPPLLGTCTPANSVLHVASLTDIADHILSSGPRYMPGDIRSTVVETLGDHTSGVLLFGINKGTVQSGCIRRNRPVRVYHITGRLGIATENHLPNANVTVCSNHRHITADKISGLASSMQASHQRYMYKLCGVDLQTQAAYELACKGLIRPADNSQPIIYGIKLIKFERPHFTLEVHTVNETEKYLAGLVHDIALELRTVAHCSQLCCVRHGHFGVRDSLLRHGWHLPGIVKNLRQNRDILRAHSQMIKLERGELHA